MKIVLESSSLFFKKYTGIPNYIYNLYNAMSSINGVSPILGFRLKKIVTSKNTFQKELLKKNHAWHTAGILLPPKKVTVAHSLHTPFLNHKNALRVATIHDLAVHLPQFDNYAFASEYFKQKRMSLFNQFYKNADALVAVSQATKNDFLNFFDFPEERIHVVPLAPSINSKIALVANTNDELKQMDLEPKSYFIAVGGVSLRKNTFNLIKGYHLSKSQKQYKLVITGKIETAHEKPIREYISKNQLQDKIIITSYLSNSMLNILYNNAKAFLFPTFYEGFGIPILEAMQARLPVLTSNTGAAPETANGHAVLVNPFEPSSIAIGIDQMNSITETILDKAENFAKKHTWDNTAKMTLDIYKKYT